MVDDHRRQLIQAFLASPFWNIPAVNMNAIALYDQALTHSTYAKEQRDIGHACKDYERLEFLGDRILGCAIADFLYHQDEYGAEGDLSKQVEVAKNENLACIVKDKKLDIAPPLLRLGNKQVLEASMLADVFEALIGAIYLDPLQGLSKVQRLVHDSLAEDILAFDPADYVSQLNTYIHQYLKKALVTKQDFDYIQVEHIEAEGNHKFVYAVRLQGEIISRGTGKNRKLACQAAAQKALESLKHPVSSSETKH